MTTSSVVDVSLWIMRHPSSLTSHYTLRAKLNFENRDSGVAIQAHVYYNGKSFVTAQILKIQFCPKRVM